MTDLLAARSQMALSLAFHMIFATVGIGMPLLMILAEGLWMRTGKPVYMQLARHWAKGTAIMFAVGAVSGTVLSFELGLLWPTFMEHAGPVIGMPFSLEGFAFFFEAIFLGIYLYGWDRVRPWAHFLAGIGVWVSGTISGIFVVTANAWMNTPAGFTLLEDGTLTDVDPVAAMFNPSAFGQTLHMTTAAFLATGFLASGIHAWFLLRQPRNAFHRRGLAIALTVGGLFAVIQPFTGHILAESTAHHQPVKLAALEAQWETQTYAPLTLGGWPDEENEVTYYALEIPGLLSLLAFGDPSAEVKGLKEFPREDRPPVFMTRMAYQIMLASAAIMIATALMGLLLFLRHRDVPTQRPFLMMVGMASPFGIIGVEAGWFATEVGRQPWIIQGVMRTSEAVTPLSGLQVPFLVFSGVYLVLGLICLFVLRRTFLASPTEEEPQP